MQTTAAQAAGTASLNFRPAQGDSVALQCDQLADPPADPLRVGNGVSFQRIQVDQALSACQQAAARPPVRPRYQYLNGRSLVAAKRYSEAVAQYSSADRAGYAMASYGLARLYRDGLGVSRDWSEAVRLYLRAGNAGLADAFSHGGLLFATETPPDYREAKTWFEYAVHGGSADGYANLGRLYESGYGVKQDATTALSLFNEASKRGSAEGMYRVGLAYYDGIGVRKDLAAACQWFIRAASYGHPYGEDKAGRCYYDGIGVQQNHEMAFNFFVPAGQAGLVEARAFVAYMLDSGDGHPKDQQAAVQWYRAAAEQGDVFAMTQLGAHLRLGQGVAWSEAPSYAMVRDGCSNGLRPR